MTIDYLVDARIDGGIRSFGFHTWIFLNHGYNRVSSISDHLCRFSSYIHHINSMPPLHSCLHQITFISNSRVSIKLLSGLHRITSFAALPPCLHRKVPVPPLQRSVISLPSMRQVSPNTCLHFLGFSQLTHISPVAKFVHIKIPYRV